MMLCLAGAAICSPLYGPGHGGYGHDSDLAKHPAFQVGNRPLTPSLLQGVAKAHPKEFSNWCRNRAQQFGYSASVGDQMFAKVANGTMVEGQSQKGQRIYKLSSGATGRKGKVLTDLTWSGSVPVVYICVTLSDGKKFAIIEKCGNLELIKAPAELKGTICASIPTTNVTQEITPTFSPKLIVASTPQVPTYFGEKRETAGSSAIGWWTVSHPQAEETCPPNGSAPPDPPVPLPAELPCQ
jgi:hypothetical protein